MLLAKPDMASTSEFKIWLASKISRVIKSNTQNGKTLVKMEPRLSKLGLFVNSIQLD